MKLRYAVKYLDENDKEQLIQEFEGYMAMEAARAKAKECRVDKSRRVFIKVEVKGK